MFRPDASIRVRAWSSANPTTEGTVTIPLLGSGVASGKGDDGDGMGVRVPKPRTGVDVLPGVGVTVPGVGVGTAEMLMKSGKNGEFLVVVTVGVVVVGVIVVVGVAEVGTGHRVPICELAGVGVGSIYGNRGTVPSKNQSLIRI